MKNIIKTCNLTVKFSKFTFNIEIYEEFVEFLFKLIEIYEEFIKFLFKLIWRETLFNRHPNSFSHGIILHQALHHHKIQFQINKI